ncbi:uncharacterized protein K02A2.6-like [Mizuhopecten yessoensis]|uniref:uncharacterized protein K02A2.6-like n=1 Tax=Mizuhopecten yessoensis TaxID=6573 RepID=UPI000B4581EF|nr:uncharacterized protein K02A2.6-like [Mizuhopecten yessoensis]
MRQKVSDKIDELENLDIIEKVNTHTQWVSPVIVVPKPDGDIRLCVDMRRANEAIIRERHPIPTADEILYDINGSKVFSRLDLKYGYHQIELAEQSRNITTFVTHKGLYRYKRLMFGITSAPEQYQHIVAQVFHDIEGVQNISDDIVVHGQTKEEHDARLEKVLERIRETGLTLNRGKCQIGLSEIEFMGHVISGKGIGPTEERVKAIVNATPPKTSSEVRSFLGLVNFSGRYIPNLATISEPLRILTKQGVEFVWGPEQHASFAKLKECLAQAETLGHYSLNAAKTTVLTDASNVGLGAILLQEDSDGNSKVIGYASRALSDVERRYSTTEKEALAVVWGCEKFRIYLMGIDYELVTDHKPLEVLYGPRSKPNARIERWVMRLMPYRFKVRYAPGSGNIADALSRLVDTRNVGQSEIERETENYIYAVAREATPSALTTREVEEASKVDEELTMIRDSLSSTRWEKSCPQYYPVRDELSRLGYLVLRGTRLVIPKSLRERCVQLAHQGHLGIVGTKQQLRTKVWWPQMDKDVEKHVKSCHGCQIVESTVHPEPLKPTELPTGPWQDLAIDLLGPLPTGHYVFVVVDYYSRYYEIDIMKDTSSVKIVESLENMFCRHGLPVSVTSDNGPQFKSEQFRQYMKENGIVHRRTTPLHPAANGEVERQNRSLMKRIKIAHAQSKDWKTEIRTYLIAYRTTPHTTTGVSPAELMFGRKLRTKLPQIEQYARSQIDEGVRDKDASAKYRNKVYIDEKRRARESDLKVGETVLVKQKRTDKFSTPFCPEPYTLIEKNGNSCTVMSNNGVCYRRNSTFMKPYNVPANISHELSVNDEKSHPRSLEVVEKQQPVDPGSPVRVMEDTLDDNDDDPPDDPPPDVPSETVSRPRRDVKLPAKFTDYVMH